MYKNKSREALVAEIEARMAEREAKKAAKKAKPHPVRNFALGAAAGIAVAPVAAVFELALREDEPKRGRGHGRR